MWSQAKVLAKDVRTGRVKTANGSSLDVRVSRGGVTVNKAKVVATDVMASNGVIHVIDTVIIPPSRDSQASDRRKEWEERIRRWREMRERGRDRESGREQKRPGDIVDVAAGNKSFRTLVAAVKAAGLVDTLKGKGPFTVFAPTDEAFSKLPKGTLESLLRPENKKKLVSILTYHVVPGKFWPRMFGLAELRLPMVHHWTYVFQGEELP